MYVPGDFAAVARRGAVIQRPVFKLWLTSHRAAGFCALPASVDTLLHVAEALAIIRALATDLRALTANMLVMLGAEQHEMCRCSADFGAGHHQGEMLPLCVLSAHFQTVPHRSRKAC